MIISVFDFDGTVYLKDSMLEFAKFLIKKNPLRLLLLLPCAVCLPLYKLKLLSTKTYKDLFLLVHFDIKPETIEILLNKFWENEFPINFDTSFLSKLDKCIDYKVCASASPYIYLKPIQDFISFDLILATEVSYNRCYKIKDYNCRGPIKIKKIKSAFSNYVTINEAYSDNKDDLDLLKLASKGYYIQRNNKYESKITKVN